MRRLLLLSVAVLVLCAANLPGQTDDKDSPKVDEQRLKQAYQGTDGKSLVEFLSIRARGEIEPKKLNELIEQLSSKDASERQKACQQLVAIGIPAIPKLRVTARSDQAETAALANKLLTILEDEPANVTGAAVRLLAARRPEGTAEALLAFLPHSEDSVMADVRTALAGVAYLSEGKDKGKADPALLKALEDPHPLRRANAITALCAGGKAEPRATLRKLLGDKSAYVRLRASLALAQASEYKAVSTLIALLGDLPVDQGREAEAFLTELAADQAPKFLLGEDQASREKVRDAWAKWWLESDGPALIKELEKRTLTEEKLAQANKLIEKLGDDDFDARLQAEADLKQMGPMIMPLLKAALKSQDLEIRTRVKKLLTALESDTKTPLSSVVPRLIALRKPKGAVKAILAYVPFVEDESMLEELQTALNAVAFTTGKADPAIIEALTDKVPSRRAAAAVALIAGPLADHLADVRKRLDAKTEKDNVVRLRVALALAAAREKEAVPTLIRLIEALPSDQASPAEDFLLRLARDNPPKDLPEGDGKRRERAAAWLEWWDVNKKTAVMPDKFTVEFRPRYLGHVLLIHATTNQIVELDRDNKTRFTMTGLSSPYDAQWVGNNKLLVTEYGTMRVTERTTDGKITWEKKLDFYPMQAERLRNGDTFIVGQNKIVQVDRNGKEVLTITRNNEIIRAGRRLPNNEIMILTSRNQYVRMDRNGKELETANLPALVGYQSDILDNGNILMCSNRSKVSEYDKKGKEVWSVAVEQPMHAFRLPNKNVLVSSRLRPYKFIEFDNSGKKVREHTLNTYAYRIKGR